ncbi:methyltransferase domain-containing protein [Alkalicaulis satelles]|uniref:Methyltransferase domain-containing protein n=1 Tax=Alkalicaulis satelles TaxID=2609175 RepID=A0A5M6ZGZ7_9PROT|nr:methyltransferase [Alkalicaulis satelles]KAA5804043.1 methyltransferase domain-containing protein [Alkalicaulis satelles]
MGWRAVLGDWRNRLVSRPGFRRFAKAFPLTRAKARAEARAVFDLMAGFVYTQTLLACIETGLFECLADGPQSLDAIAGHAGLPREGAQRLAEAAASLDLLERRSGGRYALGRLGAALAGETGLAAMTRHHALLYHDLQDPLAVLRGEAREGRLAQFWGYGRGEGVGGRTDAYSELMGATLPMVSEEIFAAIDLKRYRQLLDVGGGEGAFLIEAARQAPRLNLALFDLPAVADRARQRLEAAGLGARAAVHGGSFLTDQPPAGADLISLVRIVHDHDDEDVMTLLRACRAALAPGGTLLLAEPMADAPGAAPMGEAYFGFYLAAMGKGRPRSAPELIAMLEAAGFEQVRLHPPRMALIASVMTARAAPDRKS